MNKEINSKRKYHIAISEGGILRSHMETYDFIVNTPDNFEYVYAIREILDTVLDLKVNESIYFQPNRDDKTTRGIILRVE